MQNGKSRKKLKPVLREDRVYLGDNGRCFCGRLRCAGMTAHFTGRTLAGQDVLELDFAVVKAEGFDPADFRCEGCGQELAAVVVPSVAVRS